MKRLDAELSPNGKRKDNGDALISSLKKPHVFRARIMDAWRSPEKPVEAVRST
ncbi:MAG TPA: hypothetical protein PKE16_03135 [Hyphomicrobium sp.]|nr:hypothetical protein [Hyphomicrobium sp.]